MPEPNRILLTLLERLRSGLLDGPGMNCRPHRSRQRVDLSQFEKLSSQPPGRIVRELLGPDRFGAIDIKLIDAPRRDAAGGNAGDVDKSADPKDTPSVTPSATGSDQAQRRRRIDVNDPYYQQQALLRKLKAIAEDARLYEQDTGADVLHLGFPLLHLPLGSMRGQSATRRLLSPVCFIPVTLNLRTGSRSAVELVCRADKMDWVVPNPSLLAWLEQSGQKVPEDLMDDGTLGPWQGIAGLVRWLAECFSIDVPELFEAPELPAIESFRLAPAPRADEDPGPSIIPAAVLGLFPINNQALIRDMEAMVAGEALDGPVRSFLDADATLEVTSHEYEPLEVSTTPHTSSTEDFSAGSERLIAPADPCQARAVRLARSAAGLVIHGPPGTGKSQTITNIVGDHLLRGQRVLVVSDKRTALDVVADRLAHSGLGGLVAVVHDPGRDQRELYRSVREQLENLADRKTDKTAQRELARIDSQLDAMRRELADAWQSLHGPPSAEHADFHQLMGNWLSISLDEDARAVHDSAVGSIVVTQAELDACRRDLHDAFHKAEAVDFGANAWSQCVGITLDDFLARSGEELRKALRQCASAAAEVDETLMEAVPAFRADVPLDDQVCARSRAADLIDGLLSGADQAVVAHWTHADEESRQYGRQRLLNAAAVEEVFRAEPLDTELCYLWGQTLPQPAELARHIDTLGRYLGASSLPKRVIALPWWWRAGRLLHQYGLAGGRASAQRLHVFLKSCQARRALRSLHASLLGKSSDAAEPVSDDDRPLISALNTHHRVLALLCGPAEDPSLKPLHEAIEAAMKDRAAAQTLLDGLRKSGSRAQAIAKLDAELRGAKLFRSSWLMHVHEQMCQGKRATHAIEDLIDAFGSCESIVRIRAAVARLPKGLGEVATRLLKQSISAGESMAVVEKLSWEHAVLGRLEANPELARLDGQRLDHHIQHYRALRATKHATVCAAILHHWTDLQKERLLASTRSRLNSAGAEVRRRLTGQGNRAMRLRQVIEVGSQIDGGDPLFDLCPVWFASPETVAQVFPRMPVFDAIVFDEASQCRLEEALPVLTRGRRVVIAGDIKQLPPTRFFETALVTSQDEEAQTSQDWFELQQSEVEDLLAGALNLQIEQCYLDVHYRSRNSDLISFSNEQFYASRLQPIPGHPSNRTRFAPITLYHAHGLYQDRTNRIEAEAVCRVVHDLLRRADPPSIGIACFNTDQRDLIVECLDELAEKDADFANRLAEARARKGAAASEGLFVKNLENVQGDERDHLVISTTYGPNAEGRFYRRFGPLGRVGGGRRLNVLVTRARHEVHLITSIPPSVYRSLPPLAPGQTPNGGWLLLSYLNYAEQLAQIYAEINAELDGRDKPDSADSANLPATADVHPSASPSSFATSMAQSLAQNHRLRSQVHWGNDGFCVDVAIGHPLYLEDVTVGLLCDFNRYHRAADPIEWEIFRTEILLGQGWQLERVWTPQYFRDPTSVMQRVTRAVADFLKNEDVKNALRVEP